MSERRLPWHRRLGVRLGLFVFVLLFALDMALFPLWEYLYIALTPEYSDPEFLRGYADWIETVPPAERAAAEAEAQPLKLDDRLLLGAVTALYGLAVAAVLSLLVWWTVARRVERLAGQAGAPIDPDRGLAEPFRAPGRDEIAALAETMNDLRARVRELLERLAERDRERREWIREVSHDLRTPLAALGVSLERARDVRDPRELDELLAAARQDVRRVQDLALDLLEIARLDAGEALVREPVPLGELLRSAVTALSPLAEQRGIELELACPPGLPELAADGRRLLRALENLLANSLQHARARVRVSAALDGDAFAIAVEDDGQGFPPGPGSDGPAPQGIGLEVTRKVLAAHGGGLELANRGEGGARAVMRLPRGAEPEPRSS